MESKSKQAAILEKLLELKGAKEKIQAEEDLLWKIFYEIADDIAGPDNPYRYLNKENGMVIERIIAQSDLLNEEALLADPALLPAQRRLIVIKVERVDSDMLAVALKTGKLDTDIVARHTQHKVQQRKIGPKQATKAELAELQQEQISNSR